jgi:two-component system phosphate regulon sensor histidine kinase PhoR
LIFFAGSQIKEIVRILQKVLAGNYHVRIPAYYASVSIKQLVSVLNELLQKIESRINSLEKENGQHQAILGNMAEAVIAVDKDTRVTSVNPSAERILDIPRREIEGKLFLEAFSNNDVAEIVTAAVRNGKFLSKELNVIWPLQKILQVNATPLFENNLVSGCVLVIHDITEMRKLEKIRSDFVANVSHELKTPLTSIKGFVETLLEGAIDDKEESRNFLKIVQEHADRLDRLTSDLLSLSNLESHPVEIKKEKIEVRKLIEQITSGFSVQIKKRFLRLENKVPHEQLVCADKNKVEQVFTNLIDNAIKFNRESGLIVISSLVQNGLVKFLVKDTGIGIPEKDISRIFERFYRVDKGRSRELGGTGLGLSIVKHIVELHGGSVGVESTEGLGSEFWFTLSA